MVTIGTKMQYKRKHPTKPCPKCGKKISTQLTQWTRHQERCYKKKKFECPKCHKFFYCDDNFRTHLTTCTKSKEYHCRYCDMIFYSRQIRWRHELAHKKIFKCKICKKIISSYHGLKRHILYMHGEKNVEHNGKTITQEHYREILRKTKSRSIKCKSCEYIATSLNDLINHIKREHVKRQICPACGSVTKDLKTHVNRVHPDISGLDDLWSKDTIRVDPIDKHTVFKDMPVTKKRTCTICGKVFDKALSYSYNGKNKICPKCKRKELKGIKK